MPKHAQKTSQTFYSPRKNIRLMNYDYQTAGAYAITICAHDRQNFLLSIPVIENILKEEWKHLSNHFTNITPDLIVTMPDHLHCIIWHHGPGENTKSIVDVIGGYKSICSNVWRRYVQATNADYQGPFWQRRFYDHIIRNEKDLENQRMYMLNNPDASVLKQGKKKIEKACEYNSCGHILFPPE